MQCVSFIKAGRSIFRTDRDTTAWSGINKWQRLFWKERWQKAKDWSDQWQNLINPYGNSYTCYCHSLSATQPWLFATRKQRQALCELKSWHWGDLTGQPMSRTQLREREVLQEHRCCFTFPPDCRPLLSCPQVCTVTHALQQSRLFFACHIFLKEEPNPVMVETGFYYYLQEKHKILISDAA